MLKPQIKTTFLSLCLFLVGMPYFVFSKQLKTDPEKNLHTSIIAKPVSKKSKTALEKSQKLPAKEKLEEKKNKARLQFVSTKPKKA